MLRQGAQSEREKLLRGAKAAQRLQGCDCLLCRGVADHVFGIIYTGANLISYGVQPFPSDLITWYSIAGLIEYAINGAIVGTIYKTGPATPARRCDSRLR